MSIGAGNMDNAVNSTYIVDLFKPSDKNLVREFPELSEYEDFHGLTDSEIRFCYFFGCPTSPFRSDNPDIQFKAGAAMQAAGMKLNREAAMKYKRGEFPNNVSMGIARFASFKPTIRLKALLLTELMLENTAKMIAVTEEEMISMNSSDKAKYISIVVQATQALDTLISKIESGYGVKYKKTDSSSSSDDSVNLMDAL
jgi:hypothetical protein